ncbi:hypothetical protein GGTG_05619 [Gaeumannomyces tritici R3-111a-1]|uniref:CAIB/BAIF family enzyme n=1 Tax=Gaeumannomyces tritici (strain R3-111a-1) TaxID=644352 RepID=J3NWF5_GAET3|nr:hypothetical protein GGTG_05619 [Gaeumannomyces tritici R3-111a-1]EJT75687.1 hypothetical protein GGTG_05619 [Gaeumannomyces tritici R3-111a-1]
MPDPGPDGEFTILTPNAMLGYGYDVDQFWYGIEKYKPLAIIVDSGSTDGGPYKLGMGKMTCGRGSYVRDLEPMLAACFHHKIRVLISSVGGDGSRKHVVEMLAIVTEIADRKGYSFKVATIDAGMDRDFIKSRIAVLKVGPCGPVEPLTAEVVDGAVDVVAQMGAEPYLEALKGDPDIILGGRSYDPAPFAAFSMYHHVSPDAAWHMGKIMECGGICAVPKGRSMIATMRADSFDLTPLSPAERCTPQSVAAHTLYEKTRPDRLPGPGGVLVLDGARYEQITPKTCRVSGARFEARPYQIKLEGVTHLGYRTIFVGGIRDPILIGQIDDFLERVRKYTQKLFPELDQSDSCRLIYHVYGNNGVMGPLEPTQASQAHELAILGEVVAPTAELSHTIANNARASILHFAYPNQIATTGNLASPLSPHEQDAGAVFKFSLYHLVDLEPGEEVSLFAIKNHIIRSTVSAPEPCPSISKERYANLDNGELAPMTKKQIPSGEASLGHLATIIRSKNSGPFELTLDVMFDNEAAYNRVKAANVLTNDMIKSRYRVQDEDILTNMYFDPALAWKCTIVRPWAQGSVGERDTLGTQQHAPLLAVRVPAAGSLATNSGSSAKVDEDSEKSRNAANCKAKPNPFAIPGFKRFPEAVARDRFSAMDVVREIWLGLELPEEALGSVTLTGDDGNPALPSSFKIGVLAQSSIALSALAAAQIHTLHNKLRTVPKVHVQLAHAAVDFKSERLYTLDGKPPTSSWGPVGGLHKTSDGHIRVHDSFPNHRYGMLELLGLDEKASRNDAAGKIANWSAVDLENVATAEGKLAAYALRSYAQWDCLPQSRAISSFPIDVNPLAPQPADVSPTPAQEFPAWMPSGSSKCLKGLRVVEMSRVIAAPLCGRTLAAHGADVVWVTSPSLPDLPAIDRDLGRGKRTVQLDIQKPEDKARLLRLLRTCDVFAQGFRPGSLASHGLSPAELAKGNPGIIMANLSAFGPRGPWSGRRGYDSLVQACAGMNVSEAEHAGNGEAARPMPCQALDHAAGYFLTTGVLAAVYRRAAAASASATTQAWRVDVSLAGVMKYLRSLGQYPGATGFEGRDYERQGDVPPGLLETMDTGFGRMRAVRHAASVEGCEVGWEVMPKPLGSDEPEWL